MLGIGKVVLLRKDTGQQTMRSGIEWIEGFGGAQFFDGGVLVLQVVPDGANSVVRVRPLRPELQRGLELFQGLSGFSLVLQRQRQVVVRGGVVGLKLQRLAVVCDCVVP